MIKLKKIMAGVLVFSMLATVGVAAVREYRAEAAAKPKLNKSKVTIKVGKTQKLIVKNKAKKIKISWKTSNKSIVKIVKKSVKGKTATATIRGMKKGNAVVTAKYKLGGKKKNMKCKVTVKNNSVEATPTVTQNVEVTPTPGTGNIGTQNQPQPTTHVTQAPATATPVPSEQMQALLDSIEIPYASEIRGNITLCDSIDDAQITWSSSNKEVITDEEIDGKLPGVVTRGEADTVVTLTATVTKDNEIAKKDVEVCVLAAPAPITEDDYQGYLFGHFIGEGTPNDEQIYFATSNDGLNFKDRNNGKPVLTSTIGEKGVRDPYIYRSPEGARFFLVATDLSICNRGGWRMNAQGYYDASTTGSHNLVLWQSLDLVNWGEPKLIKVAPENAGMAWAPEMIFDDETGNYIIFFASSIMNPETKYKDKPNAIYYVSTRDFETYSEPKILIDNQTDNEVTQKQREIIDTTIIKIGDMYYSASKDGDNNEKNGGIRIMKNTSLTNPDGWEKVLDLDELGLSLTGQKVNTLDNSTLEGPELFQFNKKDWSDPNVPEYGLMADQYSVSGGYLPLTMTDIEDTTGNAWKILKNTEYSFDKLKKRHGTILRITGEELKRLELMFQ